MGLLGGESPEVTGWTPLGSTLWGQLSNGCSVAESAGPGGRWFRCPLSGHVGQILACSGTEGWENADRGNLDVLFPVASKVSLLKHNQCHLNKCLLSTSRMGG